MIETTRFENDFKKIFGGIETGVPTRSNPPTGAELKETPCPSTNNPPNYKREYSNTWISQQN